MSRAEIAVTRPLPGAMDELATLGTLRVLDGIGRTPTEDDIAALVGTADVIVTMAGHPISARVIAAAPRVRLVATMATGYDNVDVAAARARGIALSYAPGILDETTADTAFGLIICALRRFGEAERDLRAGRWLGWGPDQYLGTDVHGATLGIVGLGRIGKAVARRAAGFAMRILYADPKDHPDLERTLGARRVPLEQLLRDADVVTLHVPLRPATRHLIDARALALMKPTAVLVNTARGPIVDEHALAEALRDRRIAGAGVDVYEREPEVDPLLLAQERAVLLPHIGSATSRTRRRMALRAVDNVRAFLRGDPLLDPIPG